MAGSGGQCTTEHTDVVLHAIFLYFFYCPSSIQAVDNDAAAVNLAFPDCSVVLVELG